MSPNSESKDTGAVETEPQRAKLVAFGRFVKPELYDVFGEYDLSNVTDEEKTWMGAANLARPLFKPTRNENSLIVDNIGLNAYEYGIIVRSPVGLGRSAVSRVLGVNEIDDERIAATKRGRRHYFEVKFPLMQEHESKMTAGRIEIKDLLKEAKKPGYAHKNEAWMKEHLSAAWQEFQTILDVAHLQRGWDDDKRKRAEAALLSRLTQGSQRDRVKNWLEMLHLADDYLGARIALFTDRISQIAQELPE